MNRWLSVLLRSMIGVALIVILLRSIDLDINSITTKFTSVSPIFMILLCIMAVMRRLLMSFKWNLLLRSRGIQLSLWQAIRLYYLGYLIGTFTPGGIGADAYRVAALSRFQKNKVIASTILLERFIGLAVILVIALVALPISVQYMGASTKSFVWIIILGAVIIVVSVLISLRPVIVKGIARKIPYLANVSHVSFIRKLYDFYHAYAENRHHLGVLLAFTSLTVLEVVVLISVTYFAAISLGINISFFYLLCVMPLVYILLRIPISFQGIGIQEGLFVYFFMIAGYSKADGLSISILLRFVELVLGSLPAVGMMWISPLRFHTPADSVREMRSRQ